MPTKLSQLREWALLQTEDEEADNPESQVAKQAQQLGLVHLGFGNFGPAKGQPATHTEKDGKLVPVNAADAGKPPIHAAQNQQQPGAPAQPAPPEETGEDPEAKAQAQMFLTIAASPDKALLRAQETAHSLLNQIQIIKMRGSHATGTKTYQRTMASLKKTAAAIEILKQQLSTTPGHQSIPPAHPPEKEQPPTPAPQEGSDKEKHDKVISASVIKMLRNEIPSTRKSLITLLQSKNIQGNVFKLHDFLTRNVNAGPNRSTAFAKRALTARLGELIKQASRGDSKPDAEYEKDRDYGYDDYKHFAPDD